MAQVEQRLLACCAASACASGLPSQYRKSGTRLWRRSIDLMTTRSLSSAISANKAWTSVVLPDSTDDTAETSRGQHRTRNGISWVSFPSNGNGGPSAGECGGVKYWHEGECMDARDRKSGKTWQQEILEKQWKP